MHRLNPVIFLLLLTAFITFGRAGYAIAADERPNILFALADDWGWPHASAYGDPVVKTPTFDRLAAKERCSITSMFPHLRARLRAGRS